MRILRQELGGLYLDGCSQSVAYWMQDFLWRQLLSSYVESYYRTTNVEISLFKTSDLLDTERSSFLGFTHEQSLSPSTRELVEQLTSIIYESVIGDRRVRRYFDNYDTPFYGEPKAHNNTWVPILEIKCVIFSCLLCTLQKVLHT